MKGVVLVLGLAVVLWPGEGGSEELLSVQQPVVYGEDDRVDPSDHPSAALRELARGSIVALVAKPAIDASDVGDVVLSGQPLGAALDLCVGERFVDQPTSGFCSGTLIGPDLVLTAGHCFANEGACDQVFAVFGYEWSSGELARIETGQVFACREVVVASNTELGGRTADYAIFQLDRPAQGYVPAAVAVVRPSVSAGSELVMIGSPSGLPMKIEDGGRMRDPRVESGDYFVATTDSFGGNSGSGVFLASTLELFGILISGETDYVEDGECSRVMECLESGCDGENVMYAASAIEAFCEVATSEVLCGTAPECGDGYCAFGEAGCVADCPLPSCGDGTCGVDEWESCDVDCAVMIPASWSCEPSYYGSLDGCDCACGARDPDCDLGQEVLNCGFGETCGEDGACVAGPLSLCECSTNSAANMRGAWMLLLMFSSFFAARRLRLSCSL